MFREKQLKALQILKNIEIFIWIIIKKNYLNDSKEKFLTMMYWVLFFYIPNELM